MEPPMSRRSLRLSAGACLILAAMPSAGCQLGARVAGLGRPTIHIGTTRVGTLTLLPAEFYALQPELEKLFDQPVVFDSQFSGTMIGKQLAAGHLDFAFLSPREYAEIPEDTRMSLLATALNRGGKPAREALLIASAKSDVQGPADCRGKRFAFGPANDLLLDRAARDALRKAGVGPADLARELPPLSMTGRLNVLGGSPEIAKLVAFDALIPCGVIDEITYHALPETGGSLLAGPSRDMLRVIGRTEAVPEMVVVAGSRTDPAKVGMLQQFLIERVRNLPTVCKQMDVTGFEKAEPEAYAAARLLMKSN